MVETREVSPAAGMVTPYRGFVRTGFERRVEAMAAGERSLQDLPVRDL